MPHPGPPGPAAAVLLGWFIPEVCLPGEGRAFEIDKIFWETKDA